jgi:glutathione S-transferase
LESLAPKLDTLEFILSRQRYMAGEQFSLADAFYMPLVHLLVGLGFQDLVFKRPSLHTWWETVSEREAWKKAVVPFNKAYGRRNRFIKICRWPFFSNSCDLAPSPVVEVRAIDHVEYPEKLVLTAFTGVG